MGAKGSVNLSALDMLAMNIYIGAWFLCQISFKFPFIVDVITPTMTEGIVLPSMYG
jgi:hypothetical protein